jgi:glycine C-acetyltransferase
MMASTNELQNKLHRNTEHFMKRISAAGFDIKPSQSAIVAIMLYDAKRSQEFAARLLDEGIYVIGFYYPVVPQGQARIRVQISAGHEISHIDKAVDAFVKVGKELKVIS